jgi:putative ABC transport system permease protein
MFYFYQSSLRKISKQKVISAINLTGLVLGITTFLFIALWIRSELSFDRFWEGNDRMYRVTLTKKANGSPVLNTAMNYPGAGKVLQNELPEIEVATTVGKDVITAFTPQNSYQDIHFYYIDSSFFRVFPRPVVSENSNIFADIHGAMVSRSMAKKLFGKENPLNRKFKLNEGWEFFVCAVFDDFPENSHMKIDMMVQWKALFYYMRNFNYETGSLNNDHIGEITNSDPYSQREWSNLYSYTYIKLKPGQNTIANVASKYKKAIDPCIKHIHSAGEDVAFTFQPVSDIHQFSKLNDEISVNGSDFRIKAFGIIGLLIMIISWFNYVNLSIAVQLKQAVKVQIKRIIGASKGHLFLQQFWETFIIHAAAGIISLAVIMLLLRKGVHLAGFNIYSLHYGWLMVICLALVVTGTLFSSLYPFYKIAGMNSANTLKKVVQTDTRHNLSRHSLVIAQFGVAILLIICTCTVFKQIWFMQKQDLGVKLNQVMVSYSPMTMIKKPSLEIKLKAFQDEVMRTPGVVSFTTAETVPGKNFRRTSNNVHLDNGQENKYLFSIANIDQNYFDFFSIKMLAGSNYLPDLNYDSHKVVINATACKRLGIADYNSAINRVVHINNQPCQIIGVVDDYHHLSLKDEISPAIFFKSLHWYFDIGYYCIKVQPANLETTVRKVSSVWNNVYPDEPYQYSFLDDTFNALYKEDKRFGSTYLFFSIIAIFIASMGLFALARLAAENKIKEIGIRKVNGAKVAEMMVMLNRNFIKWVAIAFVIACPIAWYAMHQWLQNFAYKTELSWWVFALAGIVAVAVAVITVSWQSWQAATRNPVEALRYE